LKLAAPEYRPLVIVEANVKRIFISALAILAFAAAARADELSDIQTPGQATP